MEHVPRGQAEVGPHHQGDAEAEQHQPAEQPGTRRRSSSAGGNGSIPARYGAAAAAPAVGSARLRAATRIAVAVDGAAVLAAGLGAASTPWVAPVGSVNVELAAEVAQHAVAPTDDDGLGDRLLGAVDVEADVHGALEGVGHARRAPAGR